MVCAASVAPAEMNQKASRVRAVNTSIAVRKISMNSLDKMELPFAKCKNNFQLTNTLALESFMRFCLVRPAITRFPLSIRSGQFDCCPGMLRESLVFLAALLLGTATVTAQNTPNIERSPEAIALMQRVLAASGGPVSSGTFHDLVATGTVSAPMDAKDTLETTVTLSMRGLDQLRIDSALPKGTRSVFHNRGRMLSKEADGTVVPLGGEDAFSSTSHFFPLGHLAAALSDTSYAVTVPETITDDESGHTLYHLRLQRILPTTDRPAHPSVPPVALDYYVDATTNCIVRARNPYNDRGTMSSARGPFEIYRFGDYRLDHGILLPHEITVSIDKRLMSTLNISEYRLNTGLADDNFTPVARQ